MHYFNLYDITPLDEWTYPAVNQTIRIVPIHRSNRIENSNSTRKRTFIINYILLDATELHIYFYIYHVYIYRSEC